MVKTVENKTSKAANIKAKQNEIHKRIRQIANQHKEKSKNGCLVLDGVCNIEEYLSSDPKIMWILRGPYEKNNKELENDEFHEYCIWDCWDTIQHADLPSWAPIYYILKAVRHRLRTGQRIELRDMSPNDKSMLSELEKTAYINICKVDYDHSSGVEKPSEVWKEIVDEQIALYDPDIIIFGGTFDALKMEEDYDKNLVFLEHTPTDEMAKIYKDSDGKILFNAYHPSYVGGYRKDLMEWYVDEIADKLYVYSKKKQGRNYEE